MSINPNIFDEEALELLRSGRTIHIVPDDDELRHDNNTACWCDTRIVMYPDGGTVCEHIGYQERLARYNEIVNRNKFSAA